MERISCVKNIDSGYYCQLVMTIVSVNRYGIKCKTSLEFCENKGWINPIDRDGQFQCYFRYQLGRRSLDYERQISRYKGIVSRFKGKLIDMIEDVNGQTNFISLG